MNNLSAINILTEKIEKINSLKIEKKKALKEYTSFKVGGPADLFVTPKNIKAVQNLMPAVIESELPYFIIGEGSNLIISDKDIEVLLFIQENSKVIK